MAKEIVLQNATGEDLYPHTSVECVERFANVVEENVFDLAYDKVHIDATLSGYAKWRATLDSDTQDFNFDFIDEDDYIL